MSSDERTPAERLSESVQSFGQKEASGGIVLFACVVVAMGCVNSPFGDAYRALWETPFSLGFGASRVGKPLHFWINDALMAIFFLVVGLEIKREVLVGELSSARQALLPLAAAAGGMAVPAALYAAFNHDGPGAPGWGIPMATDIAFALGALALFGKRVPAGLRVFLAALAIFDDLGAVLVIGLYYTERIGLTALAAVGVVFALALTANRFGVRSLLVYGALGVGLWIAMLNSGLHPTVAGVLLALAIPARPRIEPRVMVHRGHKLLAEFERKSKHGESVLRDEQQPKILHEIAVTSSRASTPLQRVEHALLPWVAFFVVPVFALANAGVVISGLPAAAVLHPVTLGTAVGLVVGKPIGIVLCTWIAIRTGLGAMPEGVDWRQLAAVGCLGGIGFTMSLFIGDLAFGEAPLSDAAKIGILTGSVISGVVGASLLWAALPSAGASIGSAKRQ